MQQARAEILCILMTFPAQHPGGHLPTRPEPTATIVYLGAGLGQMLKKKIPALLGGVALHQLCACSETQFLSLQIGNRFCLEAVVAVRAGMILGMQPIRLVHGQDDS